MPEPSLKWRTCPPPTPPPPFPSPLRTWIATFGSLFCPWMSWFPDFFDSRTVGEIAEYAAAHRQRSIGRRWKTSKQIYIHILALNEFWPLKAFFSSGRRLSCSNCSFIVYSNALRPRQLPSVDMSMPNRHAHVQIGPIVRRVRNTYKKRLSETLTYVLCDSVEYLYALLRIKS